MVAIKKQIVDKIDNDYDGNNCKAKNKSYNVIRKIYVDFRI